MKLIERLNRSDGIKAIIGSACLWAWFDAFFMSAFFANPDSQGLMSEVATMVTFGLSALLVILVFIKQSAVANMLAHKKQMIALAITGTVGSLLLVLSSLTMNWIILAAGGLLCALYMTFFTLGWGAVYSYKGAQTATLYVAGGFAGAVIIDIPFLLMVPLAKAAFFALLPVACCIFLLSQKEEKRRYHSSQAARAPQVKKPKSRLVNYLGISKTVLGALVLVIIGFGYLQHMMSFSAIIPGEELSGVFIQMLRGAAALLMFFIIVLAPKQASAVYRVGLLLMIAGFSIMPFLFNTDLYPLSGGIIIAGYTAFDLLTWTVFSQVAFSQSKSPIKTIAVMRLIVGMCYVVGAAAGIVLVGDWTQLHEFVTAETLFIGYLVVIATVLLLSSEDVLMLFKGTLVSYDSQAVEASTGDAQNEYLERCFEGFLLTAREKEIAALLIQGRTQPWIAESLVISENTVGTHVRHIYQKAEVHNRQEFIDLVSMASD